MMTLVAVIHILVALVLIALVLIQDSKGGGALGIGGGGSNSLLGATGAQTLAAKLTRITAVVFAGTCIGLTVMTARNTGSVVDVLPASSPAASSPTGDGTLPATAPGAPTPVQDAAPAVPAENTAPAAPTN